MEFIRHKERECKPTRSVPAIKKTVSEAPRIPYPIRSLYSPLLLAERFSENDVIQRKPDNTKHVTFFDEERYPSALVEEEDYLLKKPIMVYETFGPNKAQMENIYAETLKYEGETIAVLGINSVCDKRKPAIYSITSEEQANDAIKENFPKITAKKHHDAQIQPFIWKPTASTSGYDLPYFEVRGGLMTEAEKIKNEKIEMMKKKIDSKIVTTRQNLGEANMIYIDAKRKSRVVGNGITEKDLDERLNVIQQHQNQFDLLINQIKDLDNPRVLYRWIDRDVTNDESNEINQNGLNVMAKSSTPALLSGSYNWDHEGKLPQLGTFINRLNEYEIMLRDTWHQLNRTIQAKKGFYLPEPALIMNEAAHDKIRMSMLKSPPERQDRESEFAHENAGESRKIFFSKDFQVNKPVKGAGTPASYLHQLESFLEECRKEKWKRADTKEKCKKGFFTMLKNTRQSVFDNGQWYFVSDQSSSLWENETTEITSIEGAVGYFQQSQTLEAAEAAQAAQKALNGYRNYLANELYKTFAGLFIK